MKFKSRIFTYVTLVLFLMIVSIFFKSTDIDKELIQTSGSLELSNTKIEWGINRGDNPEQPDLGSKNKALIEKYNGIAMGNKDSKNIYVTFDLGYEAGYTAKILDVLKKNNVPAAFFITAHYVNTASDLIQRMIDEGHIVGNQFPTTVKYHI